jgi:eukaryotic-like serine/threonine-protein kinase
MSGHDDTVEAVPHAAGRDPELPKLIAERYRIVRWLGGGGMGRVYEALDIELDERVALKVLRSGLSETALERFRREVKLTRRIQHRNVARMFDIGEHGGERFLTMELVEGEPLSRRALPLGWDELRELALQLCAGLAAAHAAGVVHRDLKPDNVLIESGTGRAVITDFGIARGGGEVSVTQVGAVLGTPRYMAPEQLRGLVDVDARADVFSLGVMLYELASGTRPWLGDDAIALAVQQATQPPQPLRAQLPRAVRELIEACLARDKDGRPASAEAVAEAITGAGRPSQPAVPPGIAGGGPPFSPPAVEIPARRATTLAVLPFRCAPEEQYLADWLHEDLADTLSTTPELRVRPARSVASGDPRTVGRELAVEHVVEGSVRRLPTGVRVAARLIGVADGFQIWARKADYSEADVLGVGDRLAREITEALSANLALGSSERPPVDPRAIELYLRARAELRRFWGDHAQAAVELLEQALVHAPESPEILGTFAVASVQAWVKNGGAALREKARRAVERGLAANVADAQLAAGLLRINEGDIEGGAPELAAVLARSPMSAVAHETAGRIMIEIDLVDAGVHHLETAAGLDTGRAQMIEMDLARVAALRGEWDAADRRVAALVADPDASIGQIGSMIASRFASWRGDLATATRAGMQLAGRFGDRRGVFGLLERHVEGEPFDRAEWDTLIDNLVDPDKPRRMLLVAMQRCVEVALSIAQPEPALDVFARTVELGLIDIVWLDRCPLLAPLRATERGRALRETLAARAARLRDAFR